MTNNGRVAKIKVPKYSNFVAEHDFIFQIEHTKRQ